MPEPHAFQGWKTSSLAKTHEPLPPQGFRSPLCEESLLYPTHPQQDLKRYHHEEYGTYDHFKLTAESHVCRIGAKRPNGRGKKSCFLAESLHYLILSDLYQDRCGNFYRGFKDVIYLKSEDSMGTLFSPGRTSFPNPQSEFENDMLDGHTYAVPAEDFWLLIPASPADIERARRGAAAALKTRHQRGMDGLTFEWKPGSAGKGSAEHPGK